MATSFIQMAYNLTDMLLVDILLFVLALIVILVGGAIDLIVYSSMFIALVVIPLLVQTVIQLILVFAIPSLIPIVALYLAIRKKGKVKHL